jgi:acetolactate synthase-1/2/3 large subunit
VKGDTAMIEALVEAMETAERPVFYTGGGVINSGPRRPLLREVGGGHGLSDHLHADGPRRLPGLGREVDRHAGDARALRGQPRHAWLRPDDQRGRTLRRPDHGPHRGFLPGQPQGTYRHRPVVDQQGHPRRFPDHRGRDHVLEDMLRIWKARGRKTNSAAVQTWWQQIEAWRA